MEASKLKEILDQHRLWIQSNGAEGQRANLGYADLNGADLNGASLVGAKLSGADLRSANLRYANLWRADLNGASLHSANLWGANLIGADLSRANLVNANLTRANLTGANLTGANLTGADLDSANLTNAILPDISWIKAGCLVQLNKNMYGFYLENKWVNFVQDSFGFFIQDNPIEKTFDMLVEDRIMRNIPDWVKYSGLKQVLS